jgi:hypothetical protein
MATATKRAVVMVMRVGGDGKSGKSNGDGGKEGDCKEEGNGEQ